MSSVLVSRLFAAVLSVAALGGCAQKFATSYSSSIPASTSADWTVADVRVTVPDSLTVSERKIIYPQAAIVWREGQGTDRRAQVAAIFDTAARTALAPLKGKRPVVLNITVERFHAMTFEAERVLNDAGVHDIFFRASVTDAATGEVLASPEEFEASLPAKSGSEMVALRAQGQSQTSQITAHLESVFAGWFGIGPDPRNTFRRIGG